MTDRLRPRVPTPRTSRLVIGWTVVSAVVLIAFAAIGLVGWVPAGEEPDQVPPSVRSAPGGYRSYQEWHTGFYGGK